MIQRLSKKLGKKSRRKSKEEIEDIFAYFKTKESIEEALSNQELLNFLRHIPLHPSSVSMEQARKDFRRERVLLNDVPFIPDQVDEFRSNGFDLTLMKLVERLKLQGHQHYKNESDIAALVLKRACRTCAGADSFFMVQKLFAIEGYFVMQKSFATDPPIRVDVFIYRANHDNDSKYDQCVTPTNAGSFASTNIEISTPTRDGRPVSLTSNCSTTSGLEEKMEELYIEQDSLCATAEIRNVFAVYDMAVMDDITGNPAEDPLPWIEVEALVIDESNFRTSENRRRLQLKISSHFDQSPSLDLMSRLLNSPMRKTFSS